MVFDRIANSRIYEGLSPLIALAFDYIRVTDMPTLADGRISLDGRDLYVIVSSYSTKPEAEGRWEAHRAYIDLQYLVSGVERVGFAPAKRMKPGEYDSANDYLLLEGAGDFATLHQGDFMLLWPEDAHMPGIAVSGPAPVRKAVFKIRV